MKEKVFQKQEKAIILESLNGICRVQETIWSLREGFALAAPDDVLNSSFPTYNEKLEVYDNYCYQLILELFTN